MFAAIRRKPLLVILLSAFILRAAAGVGLQFRLDRIPGRSFLIEGDAGGYWQLGLNLVRGEDYALYDPPHERRVLRMPGFPALLALSIAVAGESFLFARLLLAAVGTAACGLVYWLGSELFDRKTALLAAALAGVSPVFVGFSVLILSETLFAATLLASLLATARLIRAGPEPDAPANRIVPAVLVGLTIAAACYVRPSWLLAAPLFTLLYLLLADKKERTAALLHSGLVLLALFLALLPWAWRNHQVTGHWIWTTLWVGPSLYDGLHPSATGESDMTFFDKDRLREKGLSEYEIDRHYRRAARRFVRENPTRAAELALIKINRFWKPWPNALQFQHLAYRLAVAAFFLPLVFFAAAGLWLNRANVWVCLLTAGPILYFTAIHAVFIGSLRYRLPAEYPLCVLSAAGFWHLCDRWKNVAPGGQ